ncbi:MULTISPECIES: PhzF family phenazine biosynthesis protein [Burkholderia]|uniref:PhzF family phenazine biosynthesis protein n=1 Tax=Burkholderia TaxID=32008 RepID=UPI00119BF134|nr:MULTISPECIES: PhzF family phenazine biosynthesis protein [Burkholderia]MBU9213188.1 PhzF family phenazine biosynthesis protein [Burkholderia gladioli]MDN7722423.1 PhzF family phenazine biosynthesis protein [Burkholderia gladioli]MDN7737901.1 PhzF family phenazine biosynthesis protein [Burkholderia gladioli]TWC75508.1 PhzF family phenazine biosynthesis protein [Burkholderia sp. SJZ089]TWD05021.1 PhzF family phenazine biosynthesis protein [Burkholderia sp. SJZ115]
MNATLFLVDVFTRRALLGNPVAVVLPDVMPDAARMQALAAWNGMPETVFAMPAPDGEAARGGADYHVRIWSPRRELPFAGHPSIGTARALLAAGLVTPRAGRLVQQSPHGQVTMRVDDGDDGRIWFETPEPRIEPLDAQGAREVLGALGASGRHADMACVAAGPRWLVVWFESAEKLDALAPELDAVERLSRRHEVSGITAVAPGRHGAADFELRSFGPAIGVDEDAACGGGNACAAAMLAAKGRWPARGNGAVATASQGRHLGRDASLFWRRAEDGPRFEIGGHAVLVSRGSLSL